jgi:hypothetical protein
MQSERLTRYPVLRLAGAPTQPRLFNRLRF